MNKKKVTEELGNKFAKLIEQGYMLKDACTATGIHESTFYRWMKEAPNSDDEDLRTFAWKVKQARAKDKVRAENALQKLAFGDNENEPNFYALKYYLSHRYTESWGDLDNQKIQKRMQETLKILKENVDNATFLSICTQLGVFLSEDENDILYDATKPADEE